MADFAERRHGERREHDRLVESENENLKQALQSRQVIGMAQGMLMLRYGLSEQHAFDYLSRRSQEANIKVRELARTVMQELLEEERERPAHPREDGTSERPTI